MKNTPKRNRVSIYSENIEVKRKRCYHEIVMVAPK